jgi:hypothetical protein
MLIKMIIEAFGKNKDLEHTDLRFHPNEVERILRILESEQGDEPWLFQLLSVFQRSELTVGIDESLELCHFNLNGELYKFD